MIPRLNLHDCNVSTCGQYHHEFENNILFYVENKIKYNLIQKTLKTDLYRLN